MSLCEVIEENVVLKKSPFLAKQEIPKHSNYIVGGGRCGELWPLLHTILKKQFQGDEVLNVKVKLKNF